MFWPERAHFFCEHSLVSSEIQSRSDSSRVYTPVANSRGVDDITTLPMASNAKLNYPQPGVCPSKYYTFILRE